MITDRNLPFPSEAENTALERGDKQKVPLRHFWLVIPSKKAAFPPAPGTTARPGSSLQSRSRLGRKSECDPTSGCPNRGIPARRFETKLGRMETAEALQFGATRGAFEKPHDPEIAVLHFRSPASALPPVRLPELGSDKRLLKFGMLQSGRGSSSSGDQSPLQVQQASGSNRGAALKYAWPSLVPALDHLPRSKARSRANRTGWGPAAKLPFSPRQPSRSSNRNRGIR
jgi:hypothetical protein